MRAGEQDRRVFVLFRLTLWSWSSYALLSLLPPLHCFLYPLTQTIWSLPLWTILQESFSRLAGAISDIWELTTAGCFRRRTKKEGGIIFKKWEANGCEVHSFYLLITGMMKKMKNKTWLRLKGCCWMVSSCLNFNDLASVSLQWWKVNTTV